MRAHGLKMNPKKYAFGVTAGNFLGFLVHQRGIEIDKNKATTIMAAPLPKTKKNSSPSLAEHQAALDDIKRYLSQPPVLMPPKRGKPLRLYISASKGSIGCLLAQNNEFEREQGVHYLSRTLNMAEFELEIMLGTLFRGYQVAPLYASFGRSNHL
ncbi:unnamed protein product [Prunus brigantina]